MLMHFEPELVGWLMESFGGIDVDVRTGTTVTAIERIEGGFLVRAESDGDPVVIEADLVVHAAGRAPALDQLDLAVANAAVENGTLRLHALLQRASNPSVTTAGDAHRSAKHP